MSRGIHLEHSHRIFGFWFGEKPLSQLNNRCVESWQKFNPEFEIKIFNETELDLTNEIVRHFLLRKQYAFLSDYLRLKELYESGGVYCDMDIEFVSSIEPSLLCNRAIFGYEAKNRPNSAIVFAPPKNRFIGLALNIFEENFYQKKPYLIAPEIFQIAMKKADDDDFLCLSPEYFYPYNPFDTDRKVPQLMYSDITDNTVCIHHFEGGWKLSIPKRVGRFLRRIIFS